MRKCHLNTCPVGIATQDPELRKKFNGKPEHVVNYLFMVAEELRVIMAKLGLKTINDMIGRVDLLNTEDAVQHWKASGLDLSSILEPAQILFEDTQVDCVKEQDHGLDKALDNELIALAAPALEKGDKLHINFPRQNLKWSTGVYIHNSYPLQVLATSSYCCNTTNGSFVIHKDVDEGQRLIVTVS